MQVKEPYSSLHDNLSAFKTGVYNVRLLIVLERGCSSMYRKRKEMSLVNVGGYLPLCDNCFRSEMFLRRRSYLLYRPVSYSSMTREPIGVIVNDKTELSVPLLF